MFGLILDEARKIARSPRRLLEVFRPRRWGQFFSILVFNARAGNRWKNTAAQGGLNGQRAYDSYGQYLQHQGSKLKYCEAGGLRRQLSPSLLGERLRSVPELKAGMSVLCLGARLGTEVKAFHDAGCFAVGLDLNPGPENKLVLHGDFHEVQFPAGSVDVVFTNSFDHVFDAGRCWVRYGGC